MRRVLSVVGAVAVLAAAVVTGVVAAPAPASAATGCSKSWHYITHGETGLNVRPSIGADGSRPVNVDGVQGADFWNQQFLFCRDPLWSPGHYALYSNMTGGYCFAGDQIDCAFPSIVDWHYLFQIFKLDPNSVWWTIKTVEQNFPQLERYYQPDRSRLYSPLVANFGSLTGNHLFKITPSNLLG